MKSIEDFKKTMEKELDDTRGLILETKWDKGNYETLIKLVKIMEKEEQTIKYIKQFMRGLI